MINSKSLTLFVNTIFLVVALIFLSIYNTNTNLVNIESVSIFGILVMLFIIISWKYVYFRMFSPYIVFVCSLYLCLCGQSIMWALGMEAGFRDLRENTFWGIKNYEIANGLIYSYLCLLVLHFTVVFYLRNNGHYRQIKMFNKIKGIKIGKYIIKFGWLLVLVSIAPYLFVSYMQYTIISKVGYVDQYANMNVSSAMSQFSDYLCVGILMLLFAKERGMITKYSIYVYIITLFYLFIEIQLGHRTPIILFFIAILFIFFSRKNIKFKWVICTVIIGLIGMALMRCIVLMREGIITNFDDLFVFLGDKKNNPIIDFLGDIGWNIFSLINVQRLIPTHYEYSNGFSYLISLTSIFPNLGFWEEHPASVYGALGNWLQKELGLSFGAGFTPVAESFYNFGWLGILVFYFWGRFCVFLNQLFEKRNCELSFLLLIILIGVVFKSAVRSSFLAFFKPTFFFCFLPILVLYYFIAIRKN